MSCTCSTPRGQQRFCPVLGYLALGALVLVDMRQLARSYSVIGELEKRAIPYAIAINQFPNAPDQQAAQSREAMDLPEDAPLVMRDARDRTSSKQALIGLATYLLASPPPEPDQ
ncbi:hypothetical protein ACFVYG_08945 [Streptomyces sp. NPDC058256]|uniref:hypothetical protein n=1 Tax=Streptomyces sp. NPDC058256 TaxID=3346408 RepID=UPI0036ECA3CB